MCKLLHLTLKSLSEGLLSCLLLVEFRCYCFSLLNLVGFYIAFPSNLVYLNWTVIIVEFGSVTQSHMQPYAPGVTGPVELKWFLAFPMSKGDSKKFQLKDQSTQEFQ